MKEDLGLENEIIEVWNDTIEVFRDDSGPTAPETLGEIDRFLSVLLVDGRKSEAIGLAEEAIRDLEVDKPQPREQAKDWLPIMRARLKEARQTESTE